MKKYETPMLFVDTFAPDTMIASGSPKNGNAANNQNCHGCESASTNYYNPVNGDFCAYTPGNGYEQYCE